MLVRRTKIGTFRPPTDEQIRRDIILQVLAVHNPSKLNINKDFVPRTQMERHIQQLYERSTQNG